MKYFILPLLLTISSIAVAKDFKCSVYSTTTSNENAEIVELSIDGDEVFFGSSDKNRGQWSLVLSRENVDGKKVLNLALITGRQNAAISSSRGSPDAKMIGLTHNTSIFADIICFKR